MSEYSCLYLLTGTWKSDTLCCFYRWMIDKMEHCTGQLSNERGLYMCEGVLYDLMSIMRMNKDDRNNMQEGRDTITT